MRLEMKILLVCVVGTVGFLIAAAARSSTPDTATWLARSCIGEADWDSPVTTECASLMHIYRKRADMGPLNIRQMTRRYSAAVKPRKSHPNKWVLHLTRECVQPVKWPSGLRWEVYEPWCHRAFEHADAFLRGEVPDPYPEATHFGGPMDPPRPGMIRIPAPGYKNYLYRMRGARRDYI
jgi:hypothetical protein